MPSSSTAVRTTTVQEDLAFTGVPRRAYVRDRMLFLPDGREQRLRLRLTGRWAVTSIVRSGEGYLVTDDRWFEGTVGMYRVDARGLQVESWASTGPALRAEDGSAAWVRTVVPEALQRGPTTVHAGDRRQALRGLLQPEITGYDGERVTFWARERAGRTWVRRHFVTDLVGPPRRTAPRTGRTYSPDGRHWCRVAGDGVVLGGPAGVLHWRGAELAGSATDPAWEDESHLLVTLTRGDRRTVARLGVDGRLSRALPWLPVSPSGAGFAFVR